MPTMTASQESETSIRQKVTDHLETFGPIEDLSGRATAKLSDAIGYSGSDGAFAQLIAAMGRDGRLVRELKGRRTYRIQAVGAGSGTRVRSMATPNASEEPIDYDELAGALLAQVLEGVKSGSGSKDGAWATRRIGNLEKKITELERELARASARSEAALDERDALREQLEHSQANIALLTDRLVGSTNQRAGRGTRTLNTEDEDLLRRLQLGAPKKGSSRGKPVIVR